MFVAEHLAFTPTELRAEAEAVRNWAEELVGDLDALRDSESKLWGEVRRNLTSATTVLPAHPSSPLAETVAWVQADKPRLELIRASHFDGQTRELSQHEPSLRSALVSGLGGLFVQAKRGLFRRSTTHEVDVAKLEDLRALRDWSVKTGYGELLKQSLSGQVEGHQGGDVSEVAAAAKAMGLPIPVVEHRLPAPDLQALLVTLAAGRDLLHHRKAKEEAVLKAFQAVQQQMLRRRLHDLPVSLLKEMGQARVGPLEAQGILSVQAVLDRKGQLAQIPGISGQSARQIAAAAIAVEREARDELGLRIDLDESDAQLTSLVTALHLLITFDEEVAQHRAALEAVIPVLEPLAALQGKTGDLVLFHPKVRRRGTDLTRYLANTVTWARSAGLTAVASDVTGSGGSAESWTAFKSRAAEHYGVLGELVGITLDVDAAQGHLPREVVDAVHSQRLDASWMKSSLRGYQTFGARYALVQRRVIIGDEMGLGKTVQALAAMAHLAAGGAQHFMVVCPPAVVINWMKETAKHSRLQPIRVHGQERDRALRLWKERGGLAITTYTTLSRLDLSGAAPAMLVVDEAHYVKNPGAQRSQAVQGLIGLSERTLFLTGTPMENRVSEFENLISYLQPDVVDAVDPASMVLGAKKFRAAVAPVYLRRNSDDVLSELPDLIETEEWVEYTSSERESYLDALAGGRFQDMRRTAYLTDTADSAKLERLGEIVEEARANGRKVLVFSFYRDVLDVIAKRLGSIVIGPLTGSNSADQRQRMIDEFSDTRDPAVLLSQIVAGGTGLNLQAASVVVLCEPQVKPSLEDQAVKRAHRMGQVQTVQVHRLLTQDSVDERLMAMLAEKSEAFAKFAAQSDVADASPEAVDISESQVVKRVLAEEQARNADKLRARIGSPSLDKPTPTDTISPVAEDAPSPEASPTKTSTVRARSGTAKAKPPRSAAPAAKPPAIKRYEPPAKVERVVNTCSSCDRPIDFNGHCGCS